MCESDTVLFGGEFERIPIDREARHTAGGHEKNLCYQDGVVRKGVRREVELEFYQKSLRMSKVFPILCCVFVVGEAQESKPLFTMCCNVFQSQLRGARSRGCRARVLRRALWGWTGGRC